MAKASFHSFRGEKSALIMVKANAFVFSPDPVYVPRIAVLEALNLGPDATPEKGSTFDIPDGYKLAPILDDEGNPRLTQPDEKGQQHELKCLVY